MLFRFEMEGNGLGCAARFEDCNFSLKDADGIVDN